MTATPIGGCLPTGMRRLIRRAYPDPHEAEKMEDWFEEVLTDAYERGLPTYFKHMSRLMSVLEEKLSPTHGQDKRRGPPPQQGSKTFASSLVIVKDLCIIGAAVIPAVVHHLP